MLANAPGEEQAAQLLGRGRTPGDDLQAGIEGRGVDAAGVGVLQEQPARDVLDDRTRRSGMNLDQAQILPGGKALAGLGGEGRSGDGLDKELGNLLGGAPSTTRLMPMTEPKAETGSQASALS